ncbi:hypothetical protein EV368DRAFT_89302 [Lentinula lateritia]|uniref:Uncharacterized protein n=1 Tax=Lentinula aff. lateritia TaxID=2804960 RepID=A0ACC1TI56_9AGAR|nr:hypothetical protein F5876DRAFT_83217 [Lentinula aff. lateritia]KAJ3846274.1 hypothetical protein EV368DRAFT_89302 [Lentinula lateritia]
MALSSFLLASSKKQTTVDTELDALFQSTFKESEVSSFTLRSGKLKRKHQDVGSALSELTIKKAKVKESKSSLKQKKTLLPETGKTKLKNPTQTSNAIVEKSSDDDDDEEEEVESKSDGDDENDSELENAYLSRANGKGKFSASRRAGKHEEQAEEADDDVEEASSETDDDDASCPPPDHESLTKKQRSKKPPKSISKYIPPDENQDQRNARTIFVGNLNVEVSQKRSLLKSLQRHILSLILTPSGSSIKIPKIESTRFRSVPFAVPTSRLEKEGVQSSTNNSNPKSSIKSRQHDIDRTKSWKKSSGDKDEEDVVKGEKQFLTPAQKKKVAFINQEIHASGSSVNAYIVFAHPTPASASDEVPKRKSNLPPLPDVMNPYDAARLAKEYCDGSEFMERTLRVDVVAHNADLHVAEAGRVLRTGSDVDPKRCVFVGNLDFESKEEDVRAYFEGIISAEKGSRPGEGSEEKDVRSDDEGNKKQKGSAKARARSEGWVIRVRIIRDKDTQLGKGFAYVQFADRDCVDEILAAALEPGKLKFAKRKLRVERCKTIPGGSFKVKVKSTPITSSSRPNNPNRPANSKTNLSTPSTSLASVSIPKGDPTLGAKLAHLSKEDRKSAKAGDAERMARRLAKKKSRMAMAVGRKAGTGGVKVRGKERGRERKLRSGGDARGQKGKGHGAGSGTKNKGKAISTRALEQRNMKK